MKSTIDDYIEKKENVKKVIDRMKTDNRRINFNTVAEEAGCARTFLYNDEELKEIVNANKSKKDKSNMVYEAMKKSHNDELDTNGKWQMEERILKSDERLDFIKFARENEICPATQDWINSNFHVIFSKDKTSIVVLFSYVNFNKIYSVTVLNDGKIIGSYSVIGISALFEKIRELISD